MITHAHGDHLRHGSARYIVARPGASIAKLRLGGDRELTPVEYGAQLSLGATNVSLHPAGHILGSSQVRIEYGGKVWIVSGDYKRQHDPTCVPFEQLECDVFISEATFALPVYRWPQTSQVVGEIFRWWRSNRDRGLASALFCYSLGKSQRVLSELLAYTNEPVYLHGAVDSLTGVYRRAGVEMVPTLTIPQDRKHDFKGALIMAPPSAAGTPWMRRCGDNILRDKGYSGQIRTHPFATFNSCTAPSIATAVRSILYSMLSRIVPCSMTSADRSLNKSARALIDFAISSSSLARTCTSVLDDCCCIIEICWDRDYSKISMRCE